MQVDEWRTANPWRALCELYAKLIGVVLQHWLIVLFAWQDAQRSLVVLSYSSHLIVKSRVAMLFWAAMVWAIELAVNGLSKG